MFRRAAVALIVLVPPAVAAPAPTPAPVATRQLHVRVSFSVRKYEPGGPAKAVVRAYARNDSGQPVRVPVGYDGDKVRLVSGELVLRAADKAPLKWARLEPGHERLLFELPLDEVVFQADRASRWSWGGPERALLSKRLLDLTLQSGTGMGLPPHEYQELARLQALYRQLVTPYDQFRSTGKAAFRCELPFAGAVSGRVVLEARREKFPHPRRQLWFDFTR
jgi:hypothetical protein